MQKQKATAKNDGIQKCPTCGTEMKQLLLPTSLFCINNCDLKDRAQAMPAAQVQLWYMGSNDNADYQPGDSIPPGNIRKDPKTFGSIPYIYEVVPLTPPNPAPAAKDGSSRWKAACKIVKKIKG